MMMLSLRTRLTLLLAAATLVVLCSAAVVVDWRADADMQQRFDASLLARAQALAVFVHRGNGDVESDAVADRLARFPGVALDDWYAVTCNDRTIAQSTPAPPPVTATIVPRYFDTRLEDGRALRAVALRFRPSPNANPATPGGHTDATTCTIRYALARGPLDDILRTLDWILFGSIIGACALVLLLTPWLVQRGLYPLSILDRAMSGIGPDSPGGRLPPSGTAELAPLVARFNEVLARMDAGLARERQFAAGLAHEFRTRLAELRTLVEVEARYPSGRDHASVLAEIGSIGAELEATVTALLHMTRIQSGLESAPAEAVSIASVFARMRERYQAAAQARGLDIEFEFGGATSLTIRTMPALLDIALDNLLGNALAYAPGGSRVVVRAAHDGICVVNAAPQLHLDDLRHFGERFWRKHAHGPGHAGLGLALASAAANALHMALTFELVAGELRARLHWDA